MANWLYVPKPRNIPQSHTLTKPLSTKILEQDYENEVFFQLIQAYKHPLPERRPMKACQNKN